MFIWIQWIYSEFLINWIKFNIGKSYLNRAIEKNSKTKNIIVWVHSFLKTMSVSIRSVSICSSCKGICPVCHGSVSGNPGCRACTDCFNAHGGSLKCPICSKSMSSKMAGHICRSCLSKRKTNSCDFCGARENSKKWKTMKLLWNQNKSNFSHTYFSYWIF